MAEVIVRLLASSLGYLTLILGVTHPSIVGEFLLFQPVTGWVALLTDRGRGEFVLVNGINQAQFAGVKRSLFRLFVLALLLSIALTAVPGWMNISPSTRSNAILVTLLVSQGAIQGYIDIGLRGFLQAQHSQWPVILYQVTVAAIGVLLTTSFYNHLTSAAFTVMALALVPGAVAIIWLRRNKFVRTAGNDELVIPHVSLNGLTMKISPLAIYTVLIGIVKPRSWSAMVMVRISHFVLGFLQLRIMARQSTCSTGLSAFAIIFLTTVLLFIPYSIRGYIIGHLPGNGIHLVDISWALVAGCASSACYAIFLTWYQEKITHGFIR